eukprot:CAMPEP_0174729862 /NCGR_PEP_ID=MMETSP1094-20130205/54468_1 /TAXON_ID=156173 /ORGANISM="Chrysochromulina brevifilum, Strain UTEX LB 985" /LENGTH=61 /DNA_ID=CAMNT_0015932029 /DNA_START=230 /DNA_END=415 /DNA_ORIENTATION=+
MPMPSKCVVGDLGVLLGLAGSLYACPLAVVDSIDSKPLTQHKKPLAGLQLSSLAQQRAIPS